MQVQMTRPMAIEHFKSQIAQIERQKLAMAATVSDLRAALDCFTAFIKSPSLTNAGKLAEGLRHFVASQLHSLDLKAKLDEEAIVSFRSQLEQLESLVQPSTLIPRKQPSRKS